VVVLATSLSTGHPVRPLFDGVGTSTPYKWVTPPWYVGSANIKPGPSHQDITFENGTSPLVGVNSDDAQIILNLPQGALPATPATPRSGRPSPRWTRRSWPSPARSSGPTATPTGST